MINDIKNNIISETGAKQKLNEFNEIKKVDTKNKRLINGQEILLNLFDDLLEAIYFVKKDNSNNNNNNDNNNVSVNENENENDDEYYKSTTNQNK